MRDSERKKRYYRTKPAFRERVILAVKTRHERDKTDPEYLRLVMLRKRIYATRERIAARLEWIRLAERRLFDYIRERDDIAKRRRVRRGQR